MSTVEGVDTDVIPHALNVHPPADELERGEDADMSLERSAMGSLQLQEHHVLLGSLLIRALHWVLDQESQVNMQLKEVVLRFLKLLLLTHLPVP